MGDVLIVDDDPGIRDLVDSVLSSIGLRTITAADGLQGLSKYQQNAERIRLVFLDIAMPGMDGIQMLKALKALNPRIRTIIMSGEVAQTLASVIADPSVRGFLPKPFCIPDLLSIINAQMADVMPACRDFKPMGQSET